MKYFLHDSNAFNDEKITMLFIEFGYEGLGLFYTILEKIAAQEKPVNTKVLKEQLRVGKKLNKCWEFMEKIEIISSNNGETFNKQLLNYSEKYQIKKEKTAERLSQWRENQKNKENETRSELDSNASKVKVSKVKVYKDIYIQYLSFLNSCVQKEYRGSPKNEAAFSARISGGFTFEEICTAIKNATIDPYHKSEKYRYLTPEFFTRADKLDKFLNAIPKKTTEKIGENENKW